MAGLNANHKRYWHNRGVKDARMSLPATNVEYLLCGQPNYYLPEHFTDARTYYLIGHRRTGNRALKREYYQRASLVG